MAAEVCVLAARGRGGSKHMLRVQLSVRSRAAPGRPLLSAAQNNKRAAAGHVSATVGFSQDQLVTANDNTLL